MTDRISFPGTCFILSVVLFSLLFLPVSELPEVFADDRSGSHWVGSQSSTQLESPHTLYPPTMDGDLSDWPTTYRLFIDAAIANYIIGDEPSRADLSGTFRSVWTANTLYFAVEIQDNKLVTDSINTWKDDSVEIGIDGLNDGLWGGLDDHQYTVSADGRQTDRGSATHDFESVVQRHIDGWTVEIAIPATDLGIGSLTAGKVMGLNLAMVDDDDGNDSDAYVVWKGDRTWEVQPEWGELQLLEQPAMVTPTPSGNPTATPTPNGATITYQFGLDGYSQTIDTELSSWPGNQNVNFGDDDSIGVRSTGHETSLLRYTLTGIPDNSTITNATLSLRAFEQSNSQTMDAAIFALRRPWVEAEATWNHARLDDPWAIPGADGVEDRSLIATDQQAFASIDRWYSFDITEVAQGWIDNPNTNDGVILKGASSDHSVYYGFVSSEPTDIDLRSYSPELIISYWEPNSASVQLYLPLMTKPFIPSNPPAAPKLNSIANSDCDGIYTIQWTGVQHATDYLLQEARNPTFTLFPSQPYAGTATSANITEREASRYYYRVKARNAAGDGDWSNVVWTDVCWEREPNNVYTDANGPLVSGIDYRGYPNDAKDYFSVYLPAAGDLSIDLTEHVGNDVQLQLFYQNTSNRVGYDSNRPFHIEHSGPAGWYYVYIYTASDYSETSSYTLQVTYP